MQTTLTSFPVPSHSLLDQPGRGTVAAQGIPVEQLLESTELLKGSKTVGILHNGSRYRLQTTKLGKLILTK